MSTLAIETIPESWSAYSVMSSAVAFTPSGPETPEIVGRVRVGSRLGRCYRMLLPQASFKSSGESMYGPRHLSLPSAFCVSSESEVG